MQRYSWVIRSLPDQPPAEWLRDERGADQMSRIDAKPCLIISLLIAWRISATRVEREATANRSVAGHSSPLPRRAGSSGHVCL